MARCACELCSTTEATKAEGLGRAVEEFAAGHLSARHFRAVRGGARVFASRPLLSHSPRIIPAGSSGGARKLRRAIGQERLQDWIANRVKAKKAIILLDTCESGALTQGYSRSRVDRPASEAAIGRLHEATGRPVLTAAAEGQEAMRTKLGHGVFT